MNIQLQLSTLNQRRPQGGDEVLAAEQCAAALRQHADSAQGFFYGPEAHLQHHLHILHKSLAVCGGFLCGRLHYTLP